MTPTAPAKCHRAACPRTRDVACRHTQTGHLYCPSCARAINEHNPGLVEFPAPEPAAETARPTPAVEVVEAVAAYYNLDPADIFRRSRFNHQAHPRQVVMYLLRTRGWTQTAIGAWMCRDHTTVGHAVRAEERRMARDERERRQVAELEGILERARAAKGTAA